MFNGQKLMIFASLLFILASLFPLKVIAYTYNQAQCSEIANVVNQTTPMSVDQITTLRSSTCVVLGGNATFTYLYDLSIIPDAKFTQDFKKSVMKKFCSGPETRDFLDGLTFLRMDYYDSNSTFFDRIEFGPTDCP